MLESQKVQRDEEFKALVGTHDVEVQELKKLLKVGKGWMSSVVMMIATTFFVRFDL